MESDLTDKDVGAYNMKELTDMGEAVQREGFKSRMGFILVSAGCAIGIGNVWRFPYMVGQNGGAFFVLFYLLFLVIMGIPVLTMELAVGRASGKTTMRGMQMLEKTGSKWHIHGWVCYIGSAILMMYYTTVAGWMLFYFWRFLTGAFDEMDKSRVAGVFEEMMSQPGEMMIFTALTVAFGFLVLCFGVQKGLERVTKIMMIGLLTLILVLATNSILLEGGSVGISFYLLPDAGKASRSGWGNVIAAAMNQSFFTVSLGIGAMEIFGSYMSKEHTLVSESIRIVLLDTFVALMSGLIIFPACFSFGVEPDQGPSLIFYTLPQIFLNMQGGRIWGTMFFAFMVFASFSTVTAVFENLVVLLVDNLGWRRMKSIAVNFVLILTTGVPCVLGFNIWADLKLIGGRGVMDSEDFIVSNLLLPLGSLVFVIFCTWRFGWGAEKYLEEVNTGRGIRLPRCIIPYFKYVLPVLTIVILVSGLL